LAGVTKESNLSVEATEDISNWKWCDVLSRVH
jgi:hypothetical protein